MPRSRLRSRPKRPLLSIDEILAWADNWFSRRGRWPNVNSGLIPGTIVAGHNFRSIAKQLKLTERQVHLAVYSGIDQLRRDFR